MGSLYPPEAASTRLRLNPLAQGLEDEGHQVQRWSFLPEGTLGDWVAGGQSRIGPLARGLMSTARIKNDLHGVDVGIVQRECAPLKTLFVEKRLLQEGALIWDIDDAIWEEEQIASRYIKGRSKKAHWFAANASEIWAGNQVVADWCVSHTNTPVFVVPTTTPIPAVPSAPVFPRRLAWVGSPSTAPFIEQLIWELRSELSAWEIDVVGAEIRVPAGVKVFQLPWTQSNEDLVLKRAWAGLYPIRRCSKFVLGKSGLKAVLFGAYGLPTVATATPSNADVVVDGVTGMLVNTWKEWGDALRTLEDDHIRDEWGAAARNRIVKYFNPSLWNDFQLERLALYSIPS